VYDTVIYYTLLGLGSGLGLGLGLGLSMAVSQACKAIKTSI
jgi:ABC-type nitrate/sulfonate/bicarbonate transport system permease component